MSFLSQLIFNSHIPSHIRLTGPKILQGHRKAYLLICIPGFAPLWWSPGPWQSLLDQYRQSQFGYRVHGPSVWICVLVYSAVVITKKKNHNFSHNKPNSSEFKHTSCITLIDTSVEWLSSFYIYQKIQWLTFTDMVLLLPQAMTLLHNQLILCFTSLFQKTAKTVWLSMAFCPSDDTAYWLHRWFTHPFLHDVLKFWHCLGLHLADPLVMLFTLFSYTRRSDV